MARAGISPCASLALAVAVMAAAFPARAEEAGRYRIIPVPDGALRLDSETGAVSHCRSASRGWVCEAVGDDREALLKEIDRLSRENARLREQKTPAAPALPEAKNAFPSDETVEEAVDFLEKLLRRFQDMVERLKQEKAEDGKRL